MKSIILASVMLIASVGASDVEWWHNVDMTVLQIGECYEDVIFEDSLYSKYDAVMTMREVATESLNYSTDSSISNPNAKRVYEQYLSDIITGTQYSEAIFSATDLADMRYNSKKSGEYYANSTINLIMLGAMRNETALSDQIEDQSLRGGGNSSAAA